MAWEPLETCLESVAIRARGSVGLWYLQEEASVFLGSLCRTRSHEPSQTGTNPAALPS